MWTPCARSQSVYSCGPDRLEQIANSFLRAFWYSAIFRLPSARLATALRSAFSTGGTANMGRVDIAPRCRSISSVTPASSETKRLNRRASAATITALGIAGGRDKAAGSTPILVRPLSLVANRHGALVTAPPLSRK
jgi:hypothetical protein